jgi:hypothetical protein
VSDVPSSGGPGGPGQPGAGAGQPSEEELRAALGQLRAAPVDQIVAEVASALLNAAQVKLGRRDGRLLIDTTALVTDQVRGHVPVELTQQLDEVLTQLRLAQVEAEREVAAAATQGHEEPNDLASAGQPGGAGEQPTAQATEAGSPPSSPGASGSKTSRLWVPGR